MIKDNIFLKIKIKFSRNSLDQIYYKMIKKTFK